MDRCAAYQWAGVIRPAQVRLITALVVVALLRLCQPAAAVPACPLPVPVAQPDGAMVTLVLRGDEHLHWNEDGRGFPVVRSARTGFWVYASQQRGTLVETNLVVGRVDPARAGVARVQPSALPRRQRQAPALAGPAPSLTPPTGEMKNLVILVAFSDTSEAATSAPFDQAGFDDLFNEVGYTTDRAVGSVRDFYDEVSYGTLAVNSVVAPWVTLDNGYAYYGANSGGAGNDIRPRQMVQDALSKLDAAGFDFTTVDGDGDGWVDGLTIIHAGGGEEYGGNDTSYIWSHQWALSSPVTYDGVSMQAYHTEPARRGWDGYDWTQGITRIGVICHETGHFLGLPDLYDYGYDSQGAGDFCLMAGGSWGTSDLTYPDLYDLSGNSPAHPSAWCRRELGWVTPAVIGANGTYDLNRVEDTGEVYELRGSGWASTEYFLIENRQGYGFDASLPGSDRGILIWHVDETVANNDTQSHYKVDLEEASGTQHLEANTNGGEDSDYFRSGNVTSFSDSTAPNAHNYGGSDLRWAISSIGATGDTMSFLAFNPDLKPDLVIDSVTPTTTTPTAGDEFGVEVVVRNEGGAAAGAFAVDLYRNLADPPEAPTSGDYSAAVAGLAPGASTTVIFSTVSYSAAGTSTMWALADRAQEATEDDETNNYGPATGQTMTVASAEPSLGDGSVTPTEGDTSTNFEFRVTYTQGDDVAPEYALLIVRRSNGTTMSRAMTTLDTTPSDGSLYTFTMKLPVDTYSHFFQFKVAGVVLKTAEASGPTVSPIATLTGGAVDPSAGDTTTNFEFSVTYTRWDDQAPDYALLIIRRSNGTTMSRAMTTLDTTPSDGSLYTYTTKLPVDTYSYFFQFKVAGVVFKTAEASGPTVSPIATLTGGSVDPTSGDTTTNFEFSVTYTRWDDQAPEYALLIIRRSNGTTMSRAMTTLDTTPSDGSLYTYTTKLPVDTYSYFFQFKVAGVVFKTAEASGPTVSPIATLTGGAVDPTSGDTTTNFEFSVTYTRWDDQAPDYALLIIRRSNGTTMSRAMTTLDTTPSDGSLYTYTTKLPVDTYSYFFQFKVAGVVFKTAEASGPTVD